MLDNNENINKLEKQLDVFLIEKAPYQIPENAKDILTKILPWLVLVGGILSVLSLLFSILGIGFLVVTGGFRPLAYLADIVLLAQVVLMLIAFPGLLKFTRNGWHLLFLSTLVYILYSLINWLYSPIVGFFMLISHLVSTIIILYLLFQIKNKYQN